MGMDFSPLIPPGVGISAGQLVILNQATQVIATSVTAGAVTWLDRTLYATVTAVGSANGTDYQFNWTATDTQGNVWPRSALCLCAVTS